MAGPIGEDSWARDNDPTLENLLLLEQQIIQIFGDKIVTPDLLRNNEESVMASIGGGAKMPSLEDMKGRVFFLLWDQSEVRDFYRKGTNGLRGRAIFTTHFYHEREAQSESPFRKCLLAGVVWFFNFPKSK